MELDHTQSNMTEPTPTLTTTPTPKRSLLYRWKLQLQDDRHIRYKRLSDFAAEFKLSKYNAHLCALDKGRCVALTGGTLLKIHDDESGRVVPVMQRPSHYKRVGEVASCTSHCRLILS